MRRSEDLRVLKRNEYDFRFFSRLVRVIRGKSQKIKKFLKKLHRYIAFSFILCYNKFRANSFSQLLVKSDGKKPLERAVSASYWIFLKGDTRTQNEQAY